MWITQHKFASLCRIQIVVRLKREKKKGCEHVGHLCLLTSAWWSGWYSVSGRCSTWPALRVERPPRGSRVWGGRRRPTFPSRPARTAPRPPAPSTASAPQPSEHVRDKQWSSSVSYHLLYWGKSLIEDVPRERQINNYNRRNSCRSRRLMEMIPWQLRKKEIEGSVAAGLERQFPQSVSMEKSLKPLSRSICIM